MLTSAIVDTSDRADTIRNEESLRYVLITPLFSTALEGSKYLSENSKPVIVTKTLHQNGTRIYSRKDNDCGDTEEEIGNTGHLWASIDLGDHDCGGRRPRKAFKILRIEFV